MKKFECPDFVLGDKLTAEQFNYFDKYGVIIFRNFLNSETVQLFIRELNRIEKQWLDEGREKVNGIPLKFGKDQNGNKMIQRMCFLSLYSLVIQFLLPYLIKQDKFNEWGMWVCSVVLAHEKLNDRVSIIAYFVELAKV